MIFFLFSQFKETINKVEKDELFCIFLWKNGKHTLRGSENSLCRMNSLYTLSVQFFLAGVYLNARAPPRQEATFILVQIPLSLLLQKEVFPLVVHNSYMVVDPSD